MTSKGCRYLVFLILCLLLSGCNYYDELMSDSEYEDSHDETFELRLSDIY